MANSDAPRKSGTYFEGGVKFTDGVQHTTENASLAGDRVEDSTVGADYKSIAEEWEATVVDLTVDAGATIYDGPAICGGIWLPAALSAHTVAINDNATTKITLPASLAAGPYTWRPWKAYTSLKVAPNADSTGSMTVFWKILDTRVADPNA